MTKHPTLASLAADPVAVDAVAPEEIPHILGEMEVLRARLWARIQAPTPVAPSRPATPIEDRLLTAEEAAERLGVSKRWVYRKADTLPFTRRLSGGTLRFSLRGLERWQEAKKGTRAA